MVEIYRSLAVVCGHMRCYEKLSTIELEGWKNSCMSTERETSSRGKVTKTMPMNVAQVEQVVLEERSITFSKVQVATRLSGNTWPCVVHKQLMWGRQVVPHIPDCSAKIAEESVQ